MQLSGDGAGGDAGEGACGWRLGIDGHPVAVPFDDIENPAAERLRYRSAGEHREEVAAAQAEDAGATSPEISQNLILRFCGDFNELRHPFCEFIGIALVDLGNLVFPLIAQSTGYFRRLEPRLIVAGDGGEGKIVEAKRLRHVPLLVLDIGTAYE